MQAIHQQTQSQGEIKVLVIGESCLDLFVYCEARRLSPEAPVPVLTPLEVVENLGMSGNVVQNLFALNKDLDVVHAFQEEKITKTRYVEKKSNHMFFRVDEGESKPVTRFSPEDNPNEFDVVIVSDYNKGFLSDEDLIQIGTSSKFSVLDSKRKLDEKIIKSFTFIKMNEGESELNKKFSQEDNVIVTLGAKGAKFRGHVFPSSNPKETIDVSGAGDTFTASFALKYFLTSSVEQSIIFANEMASLVVSKRGVATP